MLDININEKLILFKVVMFKIKITAPMSQYY